MDLMTAFEISVKNPLFLQKAVKMLPQCIFEYLKKAEVVILNHYFKCIVQYIHFSYYTYGNRVESYINCLLLFFCLLKEKHFQFLRLNWEIKPIFSFTYLALYLFSLLITCMLYICSIFFWNHSLKLRFHNLEECRKYFCRIFIERDNGGNNNQIFCTALVMKKYPFSL